MTTLTSPRNMLIAGIVLILLNVAAIAPAATGAVEDVVDETLQATPRTPSAPMRTARKPKKTGRPPPLSETTTPGRHQPGRRHGG